MVFSLETERLRLRELEVGRDEAFVLKLLNEDGFLRNIGDRGVRDLDGAARYILEGPGASYAQNGFGLWAVEDKVTAGPVGLSGLIKRDVLEHVDIGYAFLESAAGRGYATEACAAVMAYGREVVGLTTIVAITTPDNDASGRVLEKLGLTFEGMIQLPTHETESRYYVSRA